MKIFSLISWAAFEEMTALPMFTAALFTVANVWKPPKCPSTDKWIKCHPLSLPSPTPQWLLLSFKEKSTICNMDRR